MDLLPEIKLRRAKRALQERTIPPEVIRRIMTAAVYAPSCFNNQSWRFLLATKEEALQKVREALAGANYWMKKAPLIVVVATRPEFGCQLSDRREYALFDCGLAVENLMLQAFREGLYAHAIAGFSPRKVKEAFSIPDDYIVITLVGVGYPGAETHLNDKHRELEHSERVRKPEGEVICYNSWTFQAAEKKQS